MEDSIKIRDWFLAALLLFLIFVLDWAVSNDGPLIQTPTIIPSPSNTPPSSPNVTPSNTSTETKKPTGTMSAEQALYATRNWATVTPTPTPYPIILPCDPEFIHVADHGWEYLEVLTERLWLWEGWVELYRRRGYHDLPVEIPLAVIMHESRGSNVAVGLSCEIGLFQIIPGDAAENCPQIPENPKVLQLVQSSKNIYHGIGRLEEYSWEGHYYISGEEPIYRFDRYVSYPQASELDWWYSSEGRTTLAMFQCGPQGLRDGICNDRIGGYEYAEDILSCWVPWIQNILETEE